MQRAVHRTLVGDLEQALALGLVKIPFQREDALDPIDAAFARFAFRAIAGVDLAVLEIDGHVREGPGSR